MSSTYYQFKLGAFDCACISDGDVNYPVPNFFKDISLEQARAILRSLGLPTTHIHSPYTLLYVDTGKHKVLIDTGVGQLGSKIHELFREVDNSGLEAGIALRNLHNAGIKPSDIDTVIITHAHPDHIAGNLNADGDLNFPNAHYYICQAEWDFWFSDEQTKNIPALFVETARTNLTPIGSRVTFFEPETEIVPGITAIPTPGHTPGHLALSVTSGDKELIHVSDAVINPIYLKHPDLLLPYDIDPEQAISSRKVLCERAATSNALVFGHHYPPYPNLGHIVQQGNVWGWEPLVIIQAE